MNKELAPNVNWQEFLDSFASGWKEPGGNEFLLESEDGKSFYTYEDIEMSPEYKEKYGERELVLWIRGEKDYEHDAYVLKQIISPKKGIETYIIVPPYKDEYFSPIEDNWRGVYYGPDGKMVPERRVKGLPKKIDMEKTVELFIKQVVEKRFEVPVLVKPTKK